MLSLLTVSPSSHAAPLNRLHSGVKAPSHGQLPSVSCSPKPRRTPNVLGAETPEFGPALEGLQGEPVGPRADRPDGALSPATFASRRVSPFTAGRVGDRACPSSPSAERDGCVHTRATARLSPPRLCDRLVWTNGCQVAIDGAREAPDHEGPHTWHLLVATQRSTRDQPGDVGVFADHFLRFRKRAISFRRCRLHSGRFRASSSGCGWSSARWTGSEAQTRHGRAHACGPGDEDPGPCCARTQTQVCSVLESGRALSLPNGRRYPINPETVSPAENPKPREKHALSSWEVNFTQT